jgi:hypothetical protein
LYISSKLSDSEFSAKEVLEKLKNYSKHVYKDELHLSVSMRSYRAENVSLLVKQILDIELEKAKETLSNIKMLS